jgi:hypothetical protein
LLETRSNSAASSTVISGAGGREKFQWVPNRSHWSWGRRLKSSAPAFWLIEIAHAGRLLARSSIADTGSKVLFRVALCARPDGHALLRMRHLGSPTLPAEIPNPTRLETRFQVKNVHRLHNMQRATVVADGTD